MLTKRSGCWWQAVVRTRARAAWMGPAVPWWTSAAVCRPGPECRCCVLYQGKNAWQCSREASIELKRPTGNPGRYLRVLNCASEYGLSLL